MPTTSVNIDIAIKANPFRGRACSPWLSPPKATSIQWGFSVYGYVKFPIAFTAFRMVLLEHQGSTFMIAKYAESDDNNGFTLSVADLNGGVNATQSYDAQYLAIGK